MRFDLNSEQKQFLRAVRQFADNHVAPHAAQFDAEECLPVEFLSLLRRSGFLATTLPTNRGGGGRDMISYGLLHEEIGKVCSSVRSLITVHDMVAAAIQTWATPDQQERWLPSLGDGSRLGALAISEPNVGCDLANVETTAAHDGDSFVLNGTKCWVTGGQSADLFLLLARHKDRPTAFLMERGTPGLSIEPTKGMLSMRASMLATLRFVDAAIPSNQLLGRVGLGMGPVADTALGLGRYSVAWGCVGIAQACLEAAVAHVNRRKQFGVLLKEHQLVQRLISRMMVDVRAARLLCCEAGWLKEEKSPEEVGSTFIAKYFASMAAGRCASDAVQLHGANGLSDTYPVARYLRDTKAMEIVEGSTQMQETFIANFMHESGFVDL